MSTSMVGEMVVGRLPRGECPACHHDVALRKGGLVREHRIPVHGVRLEAITREATPIDTSMGGPRLDPAADSTPLTLRNLLICPGAGRPAKRSADPDPPTVSDPVPAPDPETVAAATVSPGHCSLHPDLELVTHRRAGIQWHGFYEDPATACPSTDHGPDDADRCRWCGGPLVDPPKPYWHRSSRRAYCTPRHRLLAFRAAKRAER